jgi:hypothetical protein
MPITATFTADFTKWNEGLRNATAGLKPLEVSAKGVQSQLEKMARSLSGEQIVKQAQLATAAVKSIGGATKLTEAEQKKLNATVTEAIAKYAALGQKAPADMLALAKATKQSESAFSGISSALGPLKGLIAATFAVSSITRLAGDALQFASDLNDLSAKTGISTKALQEFKFAGEQVGVTLDDVSTAVLQLQKHLVGGDKSTAEALKSIGLSFKELKGLAPEDQFVKIASALSKIEDPAVRNKTAFDLMGKAAANVLPLIATDLSKAAAEAERLGVVLDQQTIDQLDQLGDTWAKVKLVGEALIAKALVPMVPAFQAILDAIIPLARDFGKLPTDIKKLEIELLQLGVVTRQAAIDFLQLTKYTQPLNVATGQYEKQVKGIQDEMSGLIDKVGKAQAELKQMESATTGAASSSKKMVGTMGDWGDATAKTTKAIKDQSVSLAFVQTDIDNVAKAIERLQEKEQAQIDKEAFADLKGEFLQIQNKIDDIFDAEREWTEGTSTLLVNKSTVVKQYFDGLVKGQKNAEKSTKDWKQSIDDLANAFATLGQIAGGSLGSVLQGIGKMIGLANLAAKSIDNITAGFSAIKTSGSLAQTIGGFAQLASGILGAAAAAIELGKALFDAFTKSRPEQLQGSVLKDFGVSIGEDLGKTIADSAVKEFRGSFQAAQVGNLDKIISAGGGITIGNLGKLQDRLHDVFSLLQTGELTGAQAQDILNKNFQTFADFLGGDVNPALKEIIRLNKEFGTQSKAILDFVAKNASLAAGGFNKIAANLNAIPGSLNRIGPIAEATFGALLDGGKSVIEALQEMGPGFEAVKKALKDSGQEATGFLAQVLGWQDIVENNKGVFEALSGTLDVLKGLNNAGALTNEAFAQLGATISDAFNKLTAGGTSSADALKLMQPQLQELWELEKDFGYSVDAATQALIDQAVASGEVGEKHRSIQEQMLDLQKQELEVLKAIGKAFGVTIPDAVDKTLTAIDHTGTAFDKLGIKIDDAVAQIPDSIHIPVKFDIPEFPDNGTGAHSGTHSPDFAAGGPVYAAGGFFSPRGTDTVPAMLTPGEFVMSRPAVNRIGAGTLRALNQGGSPSAGAAVPTTVIMQIDKREIGRAIADVLPGELRRLGVRVRT